MTGAFGSDSKPFVLLVYLALQVLDRGLLFASTGSWIRSLCRRSRLTWLVRLRRWCILGLLRWLLSVAGFSDRRRSSLCLLVHCYIYLTMSTIYFAMVHFGVADLAAYSST